MYKMKFLLCALLSAVVISNGASANVISEPAIDDEFGIITVTGQIAECGYGDSVSFVVLKPQPEGDSIDYTQSDITAILQADMLAAYAQYLTDDNGVYKAEFNLENSSSGYYTMMLSNSQTDEQVIKTFYFATLKNKTDFIKDIDRLIKAENSTSAELCSKLNLTDSDSSTAKLFGIGSESLVFDVENDGFSRVLFELLKNKEDVFNMSPDDFVSELILAAQLRGLTEGTAKVMDYSDELKLDGDFVTDYNKLREEEKQELNYAFKGTDIFSIEQAQELFNDSVVLGIIKSPEGYNDYISLIDAHMDYFELKGMEISSYKKLKYREKITDNLSSSYKTISAFVSDVNKAIENAEVNTKSNTGTSSKRGGGSSISGEVSGDLYTEPPVTVTKVEFEDISNVPWAQESINLLHEKGVINGVGNNLFDPNGNVLREQFVKMVVLGMDISIEKADVSFSDVKDGKWYSNYINTAVKNGIINGVGEERFGLGQSITRQDAAAILYRAARVKGVEIIETDISYTDNDKIASYAVEAVRSLSAMGVINGMNNNEFCPYELCSRAQAAKMIYSIMNYVKEYR